MTLIDTDIFLGETRTDWDWTAPIYACRKCEEDKEMPMSRLVGRKALLSGKPRRGARRHYQTLNFNPDELQ